MVVSDDDDHGASQFAHFWDDDGWWGRTWWPPLWIHVVHGHWHGQLTENSDWDWVRLRPTTDPSHMKQLPCRDASQKGAATCAARCAHCTVPPFDDGSFHLLRLWDVRPRAAGLHGITEWVKTVEAWQKGWPCAWLADIFSWQQWLPQEAGLWQDETVCGRVFTKAGRVKTIGWLNCFKNIGGAVRLRTNSADMVLLHWPGRWLSSDAQSNFPAAVFVMIHVSMDNACFTGNRKLREESWKALTHLQQDLMWIYLAAASLFESLWHMREEYGRFNLRPQTSCFFDCLQTWKSLDSSFLDTEGLLFHFHVWIVLTVSWGTGVRACRMPWDFVWNAGRQDPRHWRLQFQYPSSRGQSILCWHVLAKSGGSSPLYNAILECICFLNFVFLSPLIFSPILE